MSDAPAVGFLEHPTVGAVGVAVGPRGLVALTLRRTRSEAAAELAERFGHGARPDARACTDVLHQVRAYLDGRRRRFEVTIDWCVARTPFQREVWRALRDVPWGRAVSYAELAALAGRPGAARAVGNAMHANPIALVIPCHRVLAAGGKLGGFGGGLHIKRALLALEGIELGESRPRLAAPV